MILLLTAVTVGIFYGGVTFTLDAGEEDKQESRKE